MTFFQQSIRCSLWLAVSLIPVVAFAQPQGLPEVEAPTENPITEEKRILGKLLFWEQQLSSDHSTACGTCHIPAVGGSDPRTAPHPGPDSVYGTDDDLFGSLGVRRADADNERISDPVFGFAPQVTTRSSPSAFGMTFFAPELFWDGRATDTFLDPEDGTVAIATGGALESQAVGPILSSVEMSHDGRTWSDVIAKLQQAVPMALASDLPPDMADAVAANPSYPDLFNAAFGDPAISARRIGFAIATYERTLVPDETPWDRFIDGDMNALTPQQRDGWDLLRQETQCLACHRPPEFTDNRFHNIGLRPTGEDLGRQAVTGRPRDAGDFKTATLRNVGLKPRLMHVGWVTDMQDALDYYNAGTMDTGHMHFTEDQDDIPLPGGNMPYSSISVPEQTPQGQPFAGAIIDFIVNGLTDPRVASETFPFDRPTLRQVQGLCSDGLDNDGNGLIDFPADPGCDDAMDNSEGGGEPVLFADGFESGNTSAWAEASP